MEKIWLQNYPQDVPTTINPDAYSSLVQLFEESFVRYQALPAFYNLGRTLTFQDIDHLSKAFAAYCQQILYLKKGDRIALMMPNILQYPIAIFGALRAGLTVVNVNPLYTPPELIHQVKDSGAETIVVLANFIDTVRQALPDLSIKHLIVTELGDLFHQPKAFFVNFFLKYIKRDIPEYKDLQPILFKTILRKGRQLIFKPVDIKGQEIAFLQYTGGTTGIAKGAMLTHRNLVANVLQAEAWFNPKFNRGKELMITALPLYHIFSLTANCLFITKIGGLNILITNPRDFKQFINEIKKFKFTIITGVNTLFNALLKYPDFKKVDFSGLKMSLGGGMAVQRVVADKWKAVTGNNITEAYGLTETSPCLTVNRMDATEYTGTAGVPVPSTDMCILNDEGKEIAVGESGEIAVKGPQVMYGYWRNPAETQKVFTRDGWLLTGDIGFFDEKGFLHISERKKDMILVSGFNVYPNEIEGVLARMEGIREVAVIGIPNESSGEVVKAFIVKENPALTIEDVLRYSHKNLTNYKVPKQIEFCEVLPKSNIGKILRRALKDPLPTVEQAKS